MTKYTITLTETELLVIDQALQNMPFKHAAPVIAAINAQLAEQRQQKLAAAE